MHRLNNTYSPKRLAFISLLAILTLAALPLPQGRAQSADDSRPEHASPADKVSHDLRGRGGDERVGVILQINGTPSAQLNALPRREGVRVKGGFDGLGSLAEDGVAMADGIIVGDNVVRPDSVLASGGDTEHMR